MVKSNQMFLKKLARNIKDKLINNTIITIKDFNQKIKHINVNESLTRLIKEKISSQPIIKNTPVIGIVTIKDENDNIIINKKYNLVVYNGREYIASKVFNKGNYTNWNITHFGIGKGGTASNDPTTKIGPEDSDTYLYDAITLNKNGDGYLNNGQLKPINSNNISILVDGNTNHYTRVKIDLIIQPAYEPDMPKPCKVNEMALFYTNSNGDYRIFSHITFEDLWLNENSMLKVEWNLLF